MTERTHLEIVCQPGWTSAELVSRLSSLVAADDMRDVIVRSAGLAVDGPGAAALVAALREPLAGSASPVPVADAPTGHLVSVAGHALLPPAPTLLLPSLDACALAVESLRSLGPLEAGEGSWRDALASIAQRLTDAGWRHVVAGGVALGWDPDLVPPRPGAGWTASAVAAVAAANNGLDAQRLWASTRLRPVRVVVDGQCVTDDIHNGTQLVVLNTARWLAQTRPDADVSLAVRGEFRDVARRLLAGDRVEVVERRRGDRFDVVYRPYQSIDPGDARWFAGAAHRSLVGQLDMIAFSNPSYHPSPALFHSVRNLQRQMMRAADGVTFISGFGRDTALAECPELGRERLHVVGCGVDVEPAPGGLPPALLPALAPGRFVVCLSATFHHKNRSHAIRTFAALCERHGYDGSLVIAGPEPFYGRSPDEELVGSLAPDVGRRVHRLGHVDTAAKWALLRDSELVLYPSVVEGFGLVPFEAGAVGTPSLSHAGSAVDEVLGVPEALVASWSPEVWADRAWALVSDEHVRSAALAAIDDAATRHTWHDVALRTWQAIDATLAMPSVRPREESSAWSHVDGAGRSPVAVAPVRHLVLRVVAAVRRRMRRG